MVGYFENGHLFIEFDVWGVFPQSKKKVKAQIDTGYSGYLTLQYQEAFPLGLVLIGTKAYTIADDSTMYSFVALGTVEIDGKKITIPIDIQPKGSILIGMQLLKKMEKDLFIDFMNESIKFQDKPNSRPISSTKRKTG